MRVLGLHLRAAGRALDREVDGQAFTCGSGRVSARLGGLELRHGAIVTTSIARAKSFRGPGAAARRGD